MYVLQGVDPAAVGAAPFDVKVVDIYNDNQVLFTPTQVAQMGGGPGGSLLLGYFSIGEAEDYRAYFNSIPKAALGPENPQWPGDYQVAFWTPEWKAVATAYLDNVLNAGYDGMYLDVVDEYQLAWAKANDPSGNPAQDMANLVAYLADYAHAKNPNFEIWANNAEELLSNDTYFSHLDGMFKENLYYQDNGSKQSVSETQYSLSEMKRMLDAGKPVIAIEYVSSATKIADVEAQAARDGVGYYTADLNLNGVSLTGVVPGETIHNTWDNVAGVTLYGTASNDTLHGNNGNDLIYAGSGNDTVYGNYGDDGFYFGPSLNASDYVDGGGGTNDQVGLQGNYAGLTLGANNLVNIETLVLMSGSDTRFGDLTGSRYSYNLKTVDSNVAAGHMLTVNFNTLLAGENVTFDGSAETNGSFLTYGGQGNDILTGGQLADAFYFGANRFGAGDIVNGAGGSDQLGLQGDYSAAHAIVFGTSQLTSVETIVLLTGADARFGGAGSAFSYDITFNNGNVAAGTTLTVNANTLRANETLSMNGSAELDGQFQVFGGAGNDTITGGAGSDRIWGGGGADTLTGGPGADTFAFVSSADSSPVARDTINDFADGDKIDLSRIDAVAGGTDDPFAFFGSTPFDGHAGELRYQNVSGNHWLVQGDTNGDGVADFELALTIADGHSLTAGDFVV